MNRIKSAGICVVAMLLLCGTVSAADIFSVRTALNTGASQKSCSITISPGEELNFSADDLEMRIGLEPGSLKGVTFTSLPRTGRGRLMLNEGAVNTFEYIDREGLNRLIFMPDSGTAAASIAFIPRAEGSSSVELLINVADTVQKPPQLQASSFDTIKNITASGNVEVTGPDTNDINIRVIRPPNKGVVRFDGIKYTYTPYLNVVGKDKFTIRAYDSMNRFSDEAIVSVRIEKSNKLLYYDDMANEPSAYAAMKLQEKGVMTGRLIGERAYFSPTGATTRGEFLILILTAAGLEGYIKPAANTGLKNDLSIPIYLKPYVKKAVDEGIWPQDQPFAYDEVPTRAEAAALTARAAKAGDMESFELRVPDAADIPLWALPAYKSLAANGMLVLHDNAARPLGGLTNAYSADLAWQLYKFRRDNQQ